MGPEALHPHKPDAKRSLCPEPYDEAVTVSASSVRHGRANRGTSAILRAVTSDGLLAEQIRGYRARAASTTTPTSAPNSTTVGPKPPRSSRRSSPDWSGYSTNAQIGDNVQEVAAGTGYWTAKLADRAANVTQIDAAPETLELNRERLGDRAAYVHYTVADLFAWRPERRWDTCVGCFGSAR